MNIASLPNPKTPSSLLKVSRWSLLALGFVYGKTRYNVLKAREDELRAKEEAERPAKEAAMKAERDKKNQEEMAYLRQQAGAPGPVSGNASGKGGDGGPAADTSAYRCQCPQCQEKYKSACGCN